MELKDILNRIQIQDKLISAKKLELFQIQEQLNAFKDRQCNLLKELESCDDYVKLICDNNKYSSRRFIKSQFGEPVFENGGKYFIKFKDGHVNYCKVFVKEYYDKWYDEFANDVKEKIDDVIGYFPI